MVNFNCRNHWATFDAAYPSGMEKAIACFLTIWFWTGLLMVTVTVSNVVKYDHPYSHIIHYLLCIGLGIALTILIFYLKMYADGTRIRNYWRSFSDRNRIRLTDFSLAIWFGTIPVCALLLMESMEPEVKCHCPTSDTPLELEPTKGDPTNGFLFSVGLLWCCYCIGICFHIGEDLGITDNILSIAIGYAIIYHKRWALATAISMVTAARFAAPEIVGSVRWLWALGHNIWAQFC